MFKNWFLLASVSCGVGFGSTLLISRNLQQSTLAGLGTVPAVAASLTILSRQRREEIERQVAKSRLGLDDVREQEQPAKDRLQLKESRCREISAHEQELQTVQQAVSRDREKKVGLERDINSLVLQKQRGESLLVQLDAKVLDRQNNLHTTQAELARTQAQKQLEIDLYRQSNLQFQSISEKIRQYSAAKKQLETQLIELQNRSQSLQTILVDKEVDLRKIEKRRNQVSIEIADLDRLLKQKHDQKISLDKLVVIISAKRNKLVELDNEISERQANLYKIAIDLVQAEARKQSAIDSAQRSELALANNQEEIRQDSAVKGKLKLEITELENSISLFSVHITGQALNIGIADLYRRWQEVSQQVSQLEDRKNQPSIIATNPVIEPEPSIIIEEWESRLTNNPYLPVFQRIDRWGSITELEVNDIFGDPRNRKGRQFNREFREYYQYLPFSIRVETSNNSIRYVKEIIAVFTPQNPLYIPQPEIVDRHTETEQYISEPEDNIIQDLNSNDESQSDGYLAERMIHTYPVCLFCERPSMPGQDRCNQCN